MLRVVNNRWLVVSVEGVAHSGAHIAAERGIAECVLILFVEKICGACVERDAVAYAVTAGQIEAGITGIAGETGTDTRRPESDAQEIAIGADASKVTAKGDVEAAEGGIQA